MPTWAEFSRDFNEWATAEGEWSGVPLPLPGLSLTLVDNHPWAKRLAGAQRVIDEIDPEKAEESVFVCSNDVLDWNVINGWYSRREQRYIAIVSNGKSFKAVRFGKHDPTRRLDLMLNTFKAHEAWSLDTERTAQDKLATLIKPHLFDAYQLTGMFVETSKRSRLTYIFRRLRPTVVIAWENGKGGVLCALCLHPIGYYEDSFAGSMCPTDEVIAHLMLMRGDEHLYWKRANQHEPWRPEAGL